MATTVLANLFIALTFYGMMSGSRMITCFNLALASVQSLYPVMLLFPVVIYLGQKSSGKSSMIRTVQVYFLCLVGLLYISSLLGGSWKFIESTYGFMYVYFTYNSKMYTCIY